MTARNPIPRRCLGRCGRLIYAPASYCPDCQPANPRHSSAWVRIRAAALRVQPQCIVCGSRLRLEVDHIFALADGGHLSGPLAVLCHEHHRQVGAERRAGQRSSILDGREHLFLRIGAGAVTRGLPPRLPRVTPPAATTAAEPVVDDAQPPAIG